jgi:hypothetical protein
MNINYKMKYNKEKIEKFCKKKNIEFQGRDGKVLIN